MNKKYVKMGRWAFGCGDVRAHSAPVIAKELKTLAYDCGNPVQYVCGRMPAVLFYLLDRHALLAMNPSM